MVHGGSRFRVTALIDADARSAIADLAPLHQPRVLAGIDAAALLPGVPAVACFDTAFHAGLSEAAATYALPTAWPERFGLRHYGFHGLSHGHASRCAAGLVGRSAGRLRMVPCHPGAGGCFPPAGRSTPPRASRLWRAGDMRDVQATAGGGDHDVRPALGVYLHRLRREIAAMGGPDVLVFTGGIGEPIPPCVPLPPPGRVSSASPSTKTATAPRMATGTASAIRFVPRPGSRSRAPFSPSPPGRPVPGRAAIADPGVPRVRSARPSAIVEARTSPVGSGTGY